MFGTISVTNPDRRHPLIYADVRAFVGHYTKVAMNTLPSVLHKIVPDIDIEQNEGQMKPLRRQARKHLRECPGDSGSLSSAIQWATGRRGADGRGTGWGPQAPGSGHICGDLAKPPHLPNPGVETQVG